MLLDFDPAVTAVTSQPFWLHPDNLDRARTRLTPGRTGIGGVLT